MLHGVQTYNFLSVRGAQCTLPDFTASPVNHVENTVTADCCTQKCSLTDMNHKHKAAHFQRLKMNASEAEAPATAERSSLPTAANSAAGNQLLSHNADV